MQESLRLLAVAWRGIDQFHAGISLYLLAFEHLGPVVAGIVHEAERVGLGYERDVEVGDVAHAVILTVHHGHGLGVVEGHQVLTAQRDAVGAARAGL